MDPRSYGGNSPMNNGSGVDNSGLLGNGSPNGMNNPNEMPKGAGNHGNQGGPPQQQNPHHQGPHPGQGGGGSNAVNIADYFNQLVRDKKNLSYLPNYFLHCERLLDEEINKVKNLLCSATDRKPLDLPEPKGPTVTLTEKIFVPVDKYPNFNFVGRILGPQGTTAKDIEMFTGCKIMVRGEGSMRDKKKEEQLKGKPNFEHLNEKLHVLIQCEDTHNRGEVRMEAVIKEIKKLLDPKPDGEDEIKRRQLMGLAVINGTYRETHNVKHHHHHNHHHHQNHMNNQHAAAAAQQLAVFPELAGLLPGFNPNAGVGAGSPAGLTGLTGAGGLDQATLLAQLNNANLASLIGGNSLRHGGGSGANGMNRFGVTNLLPTSLPVSVASQNAFLQASGLQSPAADAGLLYAAAAGYDPQSMIQLGLLSANSPVASQSDIGAGAAGSSESSFDFD
ncbi:RNA-binding protein asd-2-like isoform X3 [Symsagittifera roscoffensis]|uniref:RNA-binding protein asd-2-like isoform X3 n=1 Tax=Symsagittifera roscoffensis TaxID=84072 RepID=UPI00307B5B41